MDDETRKIIAAQAARITQLEERQRAFEMLMRRVLLGIVDDIERYNHIGKYNGKSAAVEAGSVFAVMTKER